MTLIITSVVFLQVGLKGAAGMTVALVVGGTVCTALAAAGALSSDLKVGHWIGATPATSSSSSSWAPWWRPGAAPWPWRSSPAPTPSAPTTSPPPGVGHEGDHLGPHGQPGRPGGAVAALLLGVILALILRMVGLR